MGAGADCVVSGSVLDGWSRGICGLGCVGVCGYWW